MTDESTPFTDPRGQAVQVFAAEDFRVLSGVNRGEGPERPDLLEPGDVYELRNGARALRMRLVQKGDGAEVSEGSEVGEPADRLDLLAALVFLAAHGERVEMLLLGHSSGTYLLPMSPLARRTGYTLVGIDETPRGVRLTDLICVSFARGTLITLPSGLQRPIEELQAGDRVLTRDHGPQPVAWIGRAALRAIGSFAPVVIGAGTLGNARDLIVSQHHRIFLYQPQRHAGLRTSEVLVQAKHLVDGEQVFQREGGVVEYFSLAFERHEIIYAEGIPCESLLVSEATVARLPPDMAEALRERFPGLRQDQHFGTEAGREALDGLRDALLRGPRT